MDFDCDYEGRAVGSSHIQSGWETMRKWKFFAFHFSTNCVNCVNVPETITNLNKSSPARGFLSAKLNRRLIDGYIISMGM